LVHERAKHGHDLVALQAGSEQADAAGDIEPDAARETTPPAAGSVAATPPIGNPYPRCRSGIA
jgi:hypothetical protein